MVAATVTAFLLLSIVPFSFPQNKDSSPAANGADPTITDKLHTMDGFFTENAGQVSNEQVGFYSSGGMQAGFAESAVLIKLVEQDHSRPLHDFEDGMRAPYVQRDDPPSVRGIMIRIAFPGSNRVTPQGVQEMPHRSNYFIGNDPSRWRTDVRSYREIVYRDLYDGIDLSYRTQDGRLKYEFIVDPGADPALITVSYEGVEGLRLDRSGELAVSTALGELRDGKPISYQDEQQVECAFVQRGPLSFGFGCEGRDSFRPLVIDPLIYSTFLGGSSSETGLSVEVDGEGSAYVAGITASPDFPTTPGAFNDTYVDGGAVYVTKLNLNGSALIYSTLIGGGVEEFNDAMAIDDAGNVYVTGSTASVYFPVTSGAFQRTHGGFNVNLDAFVTKLNSQGNALVYSTYLGDRWEDSGYSIDVDWNGNAYVTGYTSGPDFPVTPGSFNTTCPGGCGFVTKINAQGSLLIYSTFLSGFGPFSIAVNYPGVAYVGGMSSTGLPVTQGAFDTTWNGGVDVFMAVLNESGTGLDYCTYLGGSGDEYFSPSFTVRTGYLTVDAYGSVYVIGNTDSADFPTTPGAFSRTLHGRDVFVTKLSPNGSRLEYSTLLGGSGVDLGASVAVDFAGNAYLTGNTSSLDFPVTPGAFDMTYNGGQMDVFVAKLNATGGGLMYSTYVGGGPWGEQGRSITIDRFGHAFVAGWTFSADFPVTLGAFDTTLSPGQWDAFVLKLLPVALDDQPDLVVTQPDIFLDPPSPFDIFSNVTITATVHNMGGSNASQVKVRFTDHLQGSWTHAISDEVIPSIQYLGSTGVAMVNWTADHEDYHDICVRVDPDDTINETNEANNYACVVVFVRSMPDLVVSPVDVFPATLHERTVAVISARVGNQGWIAAGPFDLVFYDDFDIDFSPDEGENLSVKSYAGLDGTAMTVSVFSWTATSPGGHRLCAYADPPPGKVVESDDDNNYGCSGVWVLSNLTSAPDYEAVRSQPTDVIVLTGLSMSLDLSVYARNTRSSAADASSVLAFYNDTPLAPPFAKFDVPPLGPYEDSPVYGVFWVSPAAVGTYIVRACVDCSNNITELDEMNNMVYWEIRVGLWPITSLIIGSPNYTGPEPGAKTYVSYSTPLGLHVIDQSGTGISFTFYKLDDFPWGPWSWRNYSRTGQFTLGDLGWYGLWSYSLWWYSADNTGREEPKRGATLYVDDSPPTTTISPSNATVAEGTLFTLNATDWESGVRRTEYRIDQGDWVTYLGAFAVRPGNHMVSYRSIDNIGNLEPENILQLVVVPKENYKPYLAAAFGVLLAVVGYVCSRRKPWNGGKERMAVTKAFAITSMPFVLAEAATGAASFLTGQLSMPPLIGVGTGVDLAILLAGIVVAILRTVRTKPSGAGEAGTPQKR